MSTLQKEWKYLKKKITLLENKLKLGVLEKPSSLTEGICDAINNLITKFYKQTGPKTLGDAISDECWKFQDWVSQTSFMKIACTYLQENVLTPHWILNNIDLADGT